ncbi:CMRF35-like molecule 5 isoform X2 [Pseudorasbora parva]|uniref:CMRF35-like molecule 5 isoform X2 n=1 Tax=Pseudorasbora parva TaxID=51549 RepID=UPI00351EE24C
MKFFSVLWLWVFLSGFKTSTTGGLSGYVGRYVIVSCSHSWASTNIKYFCRHPCEDRDILVKSDQSPKGRYTLKDYGTGIFTVTITDLQESDSGIYWCGVQRALFDTYHEVNLKVLKDNTKNSEKVTRLRTTETQTNPETSAETQSTTPRHSVSVSSTTKDSTHTETSTVPVYFILYAAAGLVVFLIISSVGLVTCQWRKRGVTDRSIYNEHHSEEAIGVYANTPDVKPYATIKKSRVKSKDKNQPEPIYQNLLFNTSEGEAIYGNL